VPGVRLLREADIKPPVPILTGVREKYLRGLAADRLAVLDAARILADPRTVVRDDGTD